MKNCWYGAALSLIEAGSAFAAGEHKLRLGTLTSRTPEPVQPRPVSR